MAVNHTHIAASVDEVFAVLAVPDRYADWVVGASDIRDADDGWPAVGTRFHHTQFVPRIGLKDTTEVLAQTPPQQLVLEVRARPLIVARVTIDLAPDGTGTRLTMTEVPIGGWLKPIDGWLLNRLIQLRNVEALRRLRRLCERSAP